MRLPLAQLNFDPFQTQGLRTIPPLALTNMISFLEASPNRSLVVPPE